jgi:hypothetical protein
LFAAYLLDPKRSLASVSGLSATKQHTEARLNGSSPANQLINQDYQRDDQQNVDVRAKQVKSTKPSSQSTSRTRKIVQSIRRFS